ncbi:hypothetical protein [Flavobacterium sp. C3NV]|jgi:hypothetical protein|uniref:hypothetical protein n=1 Tax=Flavobacterium sp. C3NV TaxID=3393358 RepID=UPI003990262A
MKNSTPNNNENLKKCPYESLIYGNKTDMVYRKQYKGDWGHWDDLADNAAPCSNSYEPNNMKNAASSQAKSKTEN